MFQAMRDFSRAAAQGLDPTVAELVKIRASQLNKCAFCLDMHVRDARKAGEADERLFLLDAWQETDGVYTARERAALGLTEAMTLLTGGPAGSFVPDAVWQEAAGHFDEDELARLVGTITAINAWNRLNVAYRVAPGRLV